MAVTALEPYFAVVLSFAAVGNLPGVAESEPVQQSPTPTCESSQVLSRWKERAAAITGFRVTWRQTQWLPGPSDVADPQVREMMAQSAGKLIGDRYTLSVAGEKARLIRDRCPKVSESGADAKLRGVVRAVPDFDLPDDGERGTPGDGSVPAPPAR